VEGALRRGAVTEEGDDHAPCVLQLRGQGCARSHWDAAARYAVGAQETYVPSGHVLTAAATARVAGGSPEELGHHPPGVSALREEVAVPTMRRVDLIISAESRTRAYCSRFLAHAQVAGSSNEAPPEEVVERLLEMPDHPHRAEVAQ